MFHGFAAVVLLAGSFWINPRNGGWVFYVLVIAGFSIAGLMLQVWVLTASAILAGVISFYRFRRNNEKARSIDVIFISDHDDLYLQHFLEYYRADISKHFPEFDFNIEEEFLVALLVSEMETVGLIVAEIKNADTLKLCVDFLVPKHSRSQLAKTFYQCELRCIDFLGFRYVYIEPQSKIHNNYLERIGFRLVDGKYVASFQ